MNQDGSEEIEMAILQDLKMFKRQQEKDSKTIAQALEKIDTFYDKLTSMKALPLETDLSPVKELIEEQNSRIQAMIAAIPKAIKREYHFHFFPKLNIKEYYQTYSKLVLYLILLALTFMAVFVGIKWIIGYNERQMVLKNAQAVQQYEEHAVQLEIKRNKIKGAAAAQDPLNQKLKPKNKGNDVTKLNRKIWDSVANELERIDSLYTKDTLRK